MHTYMHTYIHACMHTYIHAYIHAQVEARQAADNATRAVDDANAHLALLQEAQRAIASKYDTARRQQGGLVDRLDECVDALLLAQPSLTPVTPAREEEEEKKELEAEEKVNEEAWTPGGDASVHANSAGSCRTMCDILCPAECQSSYHAAEQHCVCSYGRGAAARRSPDAARPAPVSAAHGARRPVAGRGRGGGGGRGRGAARKERQGESESERISRTTDAFDAMADSVLNLLTGAQDVHALRDGNIAAAVAAAHLRRHQRRRASAPRSGIVSAGGGQAAAARARAPARGPNPSSGARRLLAADARVDGVATARARHAALSILHFRRIPSRSAARAPHKQIQGETRQSAAKRAAVLRIMHRMRVRLDAAAAVGRLEELVAAPPTTVTSLQPAAGGGAPGDEAALLAGDLQACFARARAVVNGSMSLLDRDALVARLESAADAAEAKLLRTVDEAEAAFKAASSVGSAGMELLLREVARLSGIADQGVATAGRALADATTAEPSKYKPLVDNKVCQRMHVCVCVSVCVCIYTYRHIDGWIDR